MIRLVFNTIWQWVGKIAGTIAKTGSNTNAQQIRFFPKGKILTAKKDQKTNAKDEEKHYHRPARRPFAEQQSLIKERKK